MDDYLNSIKENLEKDSETIQKEKEKYSHEYTGFHNPTKRRTTAPRSHNRILPQIQDADTIKYYMFEMGNTVVKMENDLFYERDQVEHKWNKDGEWMRRFFDGGYDVIEIDYDEDKELVSNKRAISGAWSRWQDEILSSNDLSKNE